MVKPILKLAGMIVYHVKLVDGSLLDLFKNADGIWEEAMGGITARSMELGNAIDLHYQVV